ncbi:MAG: hypothetical protein A2Y79_08000 [Deltaproteobacteria bacterium RBG_13_43_22]|nr:MAG: hypothetical protein A2Y79_08000 [Deltaproteobacteria bacterium RBG_13_43_22]
MGHYTNLYGLEGVLQKRELRFGLFSRTNDPFENADPEFEIRISDDVTGDSSIFFDDGVLRKPFRLLCFSLSDTIDFFYKRPRMWAQYADDHRGCCLILNKVKFDLAFDALPVYQSKKCRSIVHYDLQEKEDEVSSACRDLTALVKADEKVDPQKVTDLMYEKRKLFLYTKMRDWKEEKEYRYCIYTRAQDDIFIDISDSLHEIILGYKVSGLYQRMLFAWGKEKGIPVSFIYWENGFPVKITLNDTSFEALDSVGIFK